jgi:hypothetical protein
MLNVKLCSLLLVREPSTQDQLSTDPSTPADRTQRDEETEHWPAVGRQVSPGPWLIVSSTPIRQ